MSTHTFSPTNPITLTRFMLAEQAAVPDAQGDLTLLLTSVQLAIKVIASQVRAAGVSAQISGLAGAQNSSGDDQKKLDVISNDIFVNALKFSTKLCIMASEENDEPIMIEQHQAGKYVIAFDPLDGSSVIDCNGSVGSIWGIWKQKEAGRIGTLDDLLQPGNKLVAAGYALYGGATQIVLSAGKGLNGFTLDPSIGEFILTHPNIRCPERGNIYSINEGNAATWDPAVTDYVASKKLSNQQQKPYSLRYAGSMVADVHRTLLYGGIFMYPADKKSPNGKLRLLYEVFPMAFIMEQAGGKAITNGQGSRALDVVPTSIHQRCPIILGSKLDVEDLEQCYAKHQSS